MSNAEPYWETVVRKVREQDALAAETTGTLRDEIVAAAVEYVAAVTAGHGWNDPWKRLKTAAALYNGVQS